jgi:hypothetical protein
VKQQSQILFWLLLAATASLDAIAIAWLLEAGPESRASFLYDALVSSQLALVCLWAVFTARQLLWAWCGTIAAVSMASQVTARLIGLSFSESCGIYGGYAAMLAAVLWILKRTTAWRRLTGTNATAWQYSMGHLLAAMTLIAVLVATLQGSELLTGAADLWKFLTALTVGDVALAVATTVLWASQRPLLLRLARACAVAGAIGGFEIFAALLLRQESTVPFIAYTIIMSLVIFAWLELVPIIRRDQRVESASPATATDA